METGRHELLGSWYRLHATGVSPQRSGDAACERTGKVPVIECFSCRFRRPNTRMLVKVRGLKSVIRISMKSETVYNVRAVNLRRLLE